MKQDRQQTCRPGLLDLPDRVADRDDRRSLLPSRPAHDLRQGGGARPGDSRSPPCRPDHPRAAARRVTREPGASVIINTGWKQADLVSRGSFNEAHGTPRHSSSDKVRILRLFVHAHRLCAGLQTPSIFGATESGEVFGDACIKLHLPQQSGPSGRRMPSRRPVGPWRARRRRGKQRILRAHRSGPPGAAHRP